MSKLKLKDISGFRRRILRQMISSRDRAQTLNDLCDRGMIRVRRRPVLQHDTPVIGAFRVLGGSCLEELTGCPFGGRKRGCSRSTTRALTDLRECEAVRFL